jgi:hypothetical protein
MSKAPGSTVLRQIENGLTLQVIEVETDWARDDIVALAAEEGYHPTADGTFAYATTGPHLAIAPAATETDDGAGQAPVSADGGDDSTSVPASPTTVELAAAAAPSSTDPNPAPVQPTVAHGDPRTLITVGLHHDDEAAQEAAREAQAWLDILAGAIVAAEDRAAAAAEIPEIERILANARSLVDEYEQQLHSAQVRAGLIDADPEPDDDVVVEWDARTVRAWAAEHGVDCPTRGKVPQRVIDAYLAAGEAA